MCSSEVFISCGVRELPWVIAKVLLCFLEMRLVVGIEQMVTKHSVLAKYFVSVI